MKHKNVQVGQRVIVKRSTSESWDTAKRHIGEEFTVGEVEPLDYIGEGTVYLDNDESAFWCNHKDIKRVKEQAAPSPDEGTAPKELSWPWPKGTQVRLSAEGKEKALRFYRDPEAEYILGNDGTDAPPLLTLGGEHVFFVVDIHVVLA